MARNHLYGDATDGVTLALPVPATAVVGNVVAFGEHLTGHMLTDRATTATIAAFTAAPGLKDGEASVALSNIARVIEVTTDDEFAIGDPVYTEGTGADGDYTDDGSIFCGFAVSVTTGTEGETLALALASATPAPAGS